MGLDVVFEHGKQGKKTDVTCDDALITGKIALAHLNEFPDYYVRLEKMVEEAERYHSMRGRVEGLGKMIKAEFGDLVDAGARIQQLTGVEDEQLEGRRPS